MHWSRRLKCCVASFSGRAQDDAAEKAAGEQLVTCATVSVKTQRAAWQ